MKYSMDHSEEYSMKYLMEHSKEWPLRLRIVCTSPRPRATISSQRPTCHESQAPASPRQAKPASLLPSSPRCAPPWMWCLPFPLTLRFLLRHHAVGVGHLLREHRDYPLPQVLVPCPIVPLLSCQRRLIFCAGLLRRSAACRACDAVASRATALMQRSRLSVAAAARSMSVHPLWWG